MPAGVPVLGRPLQLVSESISSAAKVHASFRTAPIRRIIQTKSARLRPTIASAAFQVPSQIPGGIPIVGRDPMRNAIAGAERAVVTIVPAEGAPLVVGVTEVGFSEHVEPAGAPVHVSATADVKAFRPVTVTVVFAVAPAATLTVAGDAAIVKSGVVPVPVPVSAAVCGLLASLSATLRVAVAAPAAVGLNVTLIVQFVPVASVAPHALVSAKDDASAPVMLTTMFFTVAVLVFLNVTVCAVLVVLSP